MHFITVVEEQTLSNSHNAAVLISLIKLMKADQYIIQNSYY